MTTMARQPRKSRTKLAMLGAAVAVAVASTATLAGAASLPRAGQQVDLKVLLLATDANDGNIQAWADNLKREGIPYDLVTGATELTASTFADGDHARYQGVIASGPNGTAGGLVDGFTAAEFDLLYAFERKFGIRQLDLNAYPGPPLGLGFPAASGTLDGTTATLTAGGLAQFSTLKGPVPFEDLDPAVSEVFGASATPCDGVAVPTCNATSFETILQGSGGASLVGIAQTKDGREEMVSTFNGNQFQLHNGLLRHGMLSWVTRGVYLGLDRSFLSVDVDDVFVASDKWSPTLKTTPEGTAAGQQNLRMTDGDVNRLVQWQTTNQVKLNMLFNGIGSEEYRDPRKGKEPLTDRFLNRKNEFSWANHTYSHTNLDNDVGFTTQAQLQSEITKNNQFAQANALPGYDPAVLVTGEHSGIGTSNPFTAPNPNMAAALSATGVRSIGADSSRESGQRSLGSALTIPRYPMNVFYNVATWSDLLDEYDWLYLARGSGPAGRGNCTNTATTTCFASPTTQAQLIDREAVKLLRDMGANDPRPHYSHQSNLISDSKAKAVENRGDGVLMTVLAEALKRYRAYYKKPFLQPGQEALTQELRRQEAWKAALAGNQVTASIQDGKVTITSSVAIDAPVTGTEFGDLYAGQRSGWRSLAAGATVTLAPNDPRSTTAPVVSGTAAVGSTLTTSDGTWTGTPTITYARQWQRRTGASSPWADIAGATGQTYAVAAVDGGQQLRSVVSASNRLSAWSLAASVPVTVAGGTTPP